MATGIAISAAQPLMLTISTSFLLQVLVLVGPAVCLCSSSKSRYSRWVVAKEEEKRDTQLVGAMVLNTCATTQQTPIARYQPTHFRACCVVLCSCNSL